MERARLYENDKKYAEAEAVYRDILKRDPQNADAIRHLASVLFRQNKIEESSVVLKPLVVTGSDQ
jgi:thioredoxin-like negative regulator of GroEL